MNGPQPSITLEQFRATFESVPLALTVTDGQARILLVSDKVEAMFGYRREELLGRDIEILAAERFRGPNRQARESLSASLPHKVVGSDGELFCVRKDGSEFAAEIHLSSLQTQDGTLIVNDLRDLGENQRSERAQAFLASIVESSEDAIIGSDLNGAILTWNQGAERLFGYAAQEVIGEPITILFPPETKGDHFRNLAGIRQQHRIERFECRRVRKDGVWIEVSAILSPIKDSLGRLRGVSAIYSDITKRKQAEAELVLAKQAAEEANRAKGEFLANMSHEIRTPMNVLLGMSSLLLETPLAEEQEDLARTIRRSTESLLLVINDILDFSKIEAGKIDIETADFALEEVIGEVVDLVAQPTSRKGLDLNVEIDPAIPRNLCGDAGRMRQVLVNLLGNAVKFTERGEIDLMVRQQARADGGMELRFEVRDTGIGIPAAIQKRIFDAFTQADGSTTRTYGGTGLGLSISKKLVELMGGRIGVESVVGEGSTFWFTLPMVPGGEPITDQSGGSGSLRGLKVLAVDDNETNRRIVKQQLASFQIECVLAENAMQAIIQVREAAANGQPFQVVILDYGMPGMNGIDLARIIRSDTTLISTRLVLMTSYAERKRRETALEAGIDVVLNKPVRLSDLHRALSLVAARTPSTIDRPASMEAGATAHAGRLLLVEDHADNSKWVMHLLRKHGYAYDVATNGEEAVRAVSQKQYSLVLMDCQMPVMDGFQATAAIRRMEAGGRRTPIVAMTAHAMQGDREKCLSAGMDDYISKPLSSEQLVAVIRAWLPGGEPSAEERNPDREAHPTGARASDAPGSIRVRVPPELRELIPGYLENRRNDVLAIHDAVEKNALDVVRVIGHGMKGSGSGYGFPRITEIGGELEQAAQATRVQQVQNLARALSDYVERLQISYE